MTRESLIQELEEAAAKHAGTELGALLLSVHNFLVAETPETPAVEDEAGAFTVYTAEGQIRVADYRDFGELRGEKKSDDEEEEGPEQ
jgi:hypothetical protein